MSCGGALFSDPPDNKSCDRHRRQACCGNHNDKIRSCYSVEAFEVSFIGRQEAAEPCSCNPPTSSSQLPLITTFMSHLRIGQPRCRQKK